MEEKLIQWKDCNKCGRNNGFPVSLGEGYEKAQILLVTSFPPQKGNVLYGTNLALMTKLILESTDEELLLEDIYLTSILGCGGKHQVSLKEANTCRKRVWDIINAIDPDLIILSGEMAASKVSGLTKKEFSYEKTKNGVFQESMFKGVLTAVPRPFLVIPCAIRLAENFSTAAGGETHRTFIQMRKAFNYIKTINTLNEE